MASRPQAPQWSDPKLEHFGKAVQILQGALRRVPESTFGPICQHGRRIESSGCPTCEIEYDVFDKPAAAGGSNPLPPPAPKNADGTKPLPRGFYPDCQQCDANLKGDHGPSHDGSRFCESGAIAAGGDRSHCTCDSCY